MADGTPEHHDHRHVHLHYHAAPPQQPIAPSKQEIRLVVRPQHDPNTEKLFLWIAGIAALILLLGICWRYFF